MRLHAYLIVLGSLVCAAQAQQGVGFPIAGVASGQSARVTALNLGTSASTADSSCAVTLQFLDSQGKQLKQTIVTLGAGKAGSLDVSRGDLPGDATRVSVRAVLLYGYSGGAPPGPQVLQQYDCNIVPSLEIYDNDSGRTSFIITEAKPLPVANQMQMAHTSAK